MPSRHSYSFALEYAKWDENGEWTRLLNEELHSLYRSLNIVREMGGHVVRMEEGRSAFRKGTELRIPWITDECS